MWQSILHYLQASSTLAAGGEVEQKEAEGEMEAMWKAAGHAAVLLFLSSALASLRDNVLPLQFYCVILLITSHHIIDFGRY